MLMKLEDVIVRYNEPHRFYHNVSHIRRMFDAAQLADLQLTTAQRLAILFHDVVYDTGSKTNEEDSVVVMNQLVKPQCEADEADLVKAGHIILHTKHHTSDDVETAQVLDLDLLELAVDWNRFLYNSDNLRKEYCQYSDEDWNKGRKGFLQGMLDREWIFNTDYFRKHHNQQARQNIMATLVSL